MQTVSAQQFWMNAPPAVEPLRLRRLPMLAAAGCFAAGEVTARSWHGPLLLLTCTLLLLLLSLFCAGRGMRVATVPVLAFWVAVGCWCATVQTPVSRQDTLRSYADGLSRTVRGRVVRVRSLRAPPATADNEAQQPWMLEGDAWEADEHLAGPLNKGRGSGNAGQSVDLAVQAIEEVTPDVSRMEPAAGGIRITLLGPALPFGCGDLVEIPLRLRVPEVYRDPGAWSYGDQLLSEGIGAIASGKSSQMQATGREGAPWTCRLTAAQGWAAAKLSALSGDGPAHKLPALLRLDDDDTAMLGAMLFGDRTRLRPSLRAGFERTGTFHLFVVSGLHVGLIAAALFAGLRRLRVPEMPAALLTVVCATAYALLTGWGAPVQRALLMTAAYLIARALGRETTGLNALGAAIVVILMLDPRVLFEAGFQMTAAVILAVAGIAAPVVERTVRPWERALHQIDVVALDAALPPRLAQFRVRLRMSGDLAEVLLPWRGRHVPLLFCRGIFRLVETLIFGIAIEVCMVMPMAVYFHRATLLALPVNLLAIPLVAVLLTLALATFAAAVVGLKTALLPGAATALLLHGVRLMVVCVSRLATADLRVPAPSAAWLCCAIVAIAFACWALRAQRRPWLAAGLAAALAAPAFVLAPEPPQIRHNTLEVTAIDVGQGDSIFVGAPNGQAMLVDAGGPNGMAPSSDRWDVGEEVVAPFLWSRRLKRLDVVVLSHAHSDHMGGMPAILRDFRPRELWIGAEPEEAPALHALLGEAASLGITIRRLRAGDALQWGDLQTSVLAPERTYANPGEAVNDDSLVLRLQYGAGSALLEGDAEKPSEAAMSATGRLSPVTLLKVGHHGSRTSTTPEFLAAVAPRAAVVSVGSHNTFGHPRREILGRLEDAHVHTWRTDREGARSFLVHRDGSLEERSATQIDDGRVRGTH